MTPPLTYKKGLHKKPNTPSPFQDKKTNINRRKVNYMNAIDSAIQAVYSLPLSEVVGIYFASIAAGSTALLLMLF